jgi:XTP/dITP diphosphohydrolase
VNLPFRSQEKVLEKLQGVENRSAYFSCVIVMLRNEKDPNPIIAEGIWPGTILHEPRGEQGFGYDSIFQAEGTKQSAAELALTVKNQLSHRAQALQQLKQFF